MNQPLVSAIVTNYNYGRFIKQAINSLFNQTYQNLEIVVVDDGSTDDSLKILADYKTKIKLISQANQGVVIARNNGAAQAKGQFIFFLDADDYVAEDYVERLMQAIQLSENINTAIAYCDFQFVGDIEQEVRACPWNPRKLLYRNYIIVSALVNKEAFDKVGGFDVSVNQKTSFEDWDLWLSLVEQGYRGAYCPKSLFFYRLHGKGRNQAALQQRAHLEHILRDRHPKLYKDPINRLYLMTMGSLSKLRNSLIHPPGT